jgi:hypothetical protein
LGSLVPYENITQEMDDNTPQTLPLLFCSHGYTATSG